MSRTWSVDDPLQILSELHKLCIFSAAVEEQLDEPVEVHPGLWLGSKHAAQDLSWQDSVGIGAVLNLASDDVQEPEGGYPETTRIMKIPAVDAQGYSLLPEHFPACFAFVEECLAESPPRHILIHCIQGLNRSGVICVASVMLLRQCSLMDAFYHCSRLRCDIVNNLSFQEQLISLADAKGFLQDGPEAAAALEAHDKLLQGIFGVFAEGGFLSAVSFRRGVSAVATVSDEQLDQLEMRLSYHRVADSEGVDGMQPRELRSFLGADSQAQSCLLKSLMQHVNAGA